MGRRCPRAAPCSTSRSRRSSTRRYYIRDDAACRDGRHTAVMRGSPRSCIITSAKAGPRAADAESHHQEEPMNAYQCIVSKRDTRVYLDQPIEEEKLRRVLQAGRMAGSSKNTQPVRLVVTRDTEWLKEIATCGQFTQPLLAARAGIAVCCPPEGSDFDAAPAAPNKMPAAWSQGIASCPTSIHDQACIREKLQLPQD